MTGGAAIGRAPGAIESSQVATAAERPAVAARSSRGSSSSSASLYFFVPLIATFEFSLRTEAVRSPRTPTRSGDPPFWSSLGYSFIVGVITIVVSIALIVPTAYWVRLRLPRLRPVVEFITLLPFVIPAVVLVFGLIRVYSRPPLPLTDTRPRQRRRCSSRAYVVLSLPYMYRAVDTGPAGDRRPDA